MAGRPAGIDASNPAPPGAWERTDGIASEAEASTRNVGQAVLMSMLAALAGVLEAAIVWAVWGGIQRGLGAAPASPPTANGAGGPGMAVLLVLACVPVLIMLVLLAWYAAVLWAGTTRVRLERGVLTISTGIGPARWTRRMHAAEARSLRESARSMATESGSVTAREIEIERRDGRPMRLGRLLGQPRLRWMRFATARMLGVPDVTGVDDDGDA